MERLLRRCGGRREDGWKLVERDQLRLVARFRGVELGSASLSSSSCGAICGLQQVGVTHRCSRRPCQPHGHFLSDSLVTLCYESGPNSPFKILLSKFRSILLSKIWSMRWSNSHQNGGPSAAAAWRGGGGRPCSLCPTRSRRPSHPSAGLPARRRPRLPDRQQDSEIGWPAGRRFEPPSRQGVSESELAGLVVVPWARVDTAPLTGRAELSASLAPGHESSQWSESRWAETAHRRRDAAARGRRVHEAQGASLWRVSADAAGTRLLTTRNSGVQTPRCVRAPRAYAASRCVPARQLDVQTPLGRTRGGLGAPSPSARC
jgi:hypothetical protein